MVGEEEPEKVKVANNARWQEYGNLIKMERKLQKKIQRDPGQGPSSHEQMRRAAIPRSNLTEWGGTDVPDRAQDGKKCRNWLEDRPVSPGRHNQGMVVPERQEEHQESGAAMTHPPHPPPSSGGSSISDSEATAESLSSGIEELMSQQAQLVETTLRFLAAVAEVGGGQWEDNPGLTERALTNWLGQQEDRVEELMDPNVATNTRVLFG